MPQVNSRHASQRVRHGSSGVFSVFLCVSGKRVTLADSCSLLSSTGGEPPLSPAACAPREAHRCNAGSVSLTAEEMNRDSSCQPL